MTSATITRDFQTMAEWPEMSYPRDGDAIMLLGKDGLASGETANVREVLDTISYPADIHNVTIAPGKSIPVMPWQFQRSEIPGTPDTRVWLQVRKGDVREIEELYARLTLRKMIEPGSTVYVVQKHVSSSGMLRILRLAVIEAEIKDGKVEARLRDITRLAALALGWKDNLDKGGLEVGGCGMDMHFHTVYSLARAIYRGVERKEGERDHGYWLNHESF